MTDAKHRRLYLVRHGEAKPKDEDLERGLTDVGHSNVRRMAGWAAASGIVVDEIRHSGKLRAKQTAEIFAETLGMQAQLRSDDGQRIGFEAIGLNAADFYGNGGASNCLRSLVNSAKSSARVR